VKFYRELDLTFRGQLAEDGQIPVSQLINALSKVQLILHFIAMETQGLTYSSRIQVPRKIKESYRLIFSGSGHCCFQTHLGLGDVTSNLFFAISIDETLAKFRSLNEHLERSDSSSLIADFPDAGYREHILCAIKDILPDEESGYTIGLREKSEDYSLFNSARIRPEFVELHYDKARIQAENKRRNGKVIGKLTDINFIQRRITVLDLVSKCKVTVQYEPDSERELVEMRRKLVRVTGLVVYGHSDKPKEVVSATITNMNTDNYQLKWLYDGSSKTLLKSPIDIKVKYNSDLEMLCAENKVLNIDVCAFSRDELEEEIQLEMASLWRTYVQEEDKNLTSDAQKLKNTLKNLFLGLTLHA